MNRGPGAAALKRYERFAREYVIDHNGTRAAIAVGYSENGAGVIASNLLKKSSVQKFIDRYKTERATKLELKAEMVIDELRRMAFARMKSFVRIDENGRPVTDVTNATEDEWAAVQEIREDATGGTGDGQRRVVLRTTLKLAEKTKALDMLMRHLGAYNDKLQVGGLESLANILAGREREKE